MTQINIQKWGDYLVGDMFDIHPTKTIKGSDGKILSNKTLLEDDGINPVVVNSAYNNGIGGYTNRPTTEKAGIITFSDTVDANTIFYQPKDFVGYSHVQGMYPKGEYKDKWTELSLKFFATVFRETALNKCFTFGNKFRRDIAETLYVKLPKDENDNPDWKYMETYMKSIECKASERVKHFIGIEKNKKNLDVSNWGYFALEDIFNIISGSASDTGKMTDDNPTVALISRKGFNNGFVSMVDELPDSKPFDEGMLSLALGGAYLGACFIQPCKFYTGEHMVVLEAKEDISFYCKQYVATVITKSARLKYRAFVDEMDSHIRTDYRFLLPVTPEGNPDWMYMEKYVREIEQFVKKYDLKSIEV